MTVVLGRVKRGTDQTFRTITVEVDGSPVDLSDTDDWLVEAQFRPGEDNAQAVEPAIAATPLEDSEIVLSLSAEQSAAMAAKPWVGDVKVTDLRGATPVVHKSATFTVLVVADVTRIVGTP